MSSSASFSDIAISVRGLSKSYTIVHEDQKHTLATEALLHSLKNIGKKPASETFWALQDVSFDIHKGDVVGIIGRNGAGKSTLLKVLSRITEPTRGQIDVYGRIGSLLEVGTGFHPELTGRENVYLNGAVLGMSRREIQKHFDAIVEFSGVEKFLDTPVKRYSSGMYVRLAFAVAAHLEPEILIVDEVLAVGDAEFQKKCLGKMKDVAAHGRTVIFVSHNMAAVAQLCQQCILLRNGCLAEKGNTPHIIHEYLDSKTSQPFEKLIGADGIELNEVAVRDAQNGSATDLLLFNQDYILTLSGYAPNRLDNGAVVVEVYNDIGVLVASVNSVEEGMDLFDYQGHFDISFSLPRIQMFPGRYTISIELRNLREIHLKAENALTFEIQPAMVNDAMWAYQKQHGVVRISNGGTVRSSERSHPNSLHSADALK